MTPDFLSAARRIPEAHFLSVKSLSKNQESALMF